jgi:hypothetical protein
MGDKRFRIIVLEEDLADKLVALVAEEKAAGGRRKEAADNVIQFRDVTRPTEIKGKGK